MSLLKEFRDFALRGNVVDMAVGIIIGTAFGKIVSSLVSDVIMPPIGLLLGKMDFSSWFFQLSGEPVSSVVEAKAKGVPTVNLGLFINTVLDFVIMAFVIFMVIKQLNRFKKAPPPVESALRECPMCTTQISKKARRCPACTSEVKPA